jgi:hypothetical protein
MSKQRQTQQAHDHCPDRKNKQARAEKQRIDADRVAVKEQQPAAKRARIASSRRDGSAINESSAQRLRVERARAKSAQLKLTRVQYYATASSAHAQHTHTHRT